MYTLPLVPCDTLESPVFAPGQRAASRRARVETLDSEPAEPWENILTERQLPAPVSRLLSGDIRNPGDIVADNSLSRSQKLDVLSFWICELDRVAPEEADLRAHLDALKASLLHDH